MKIICENCNQETLPHLINCDYLTKYRWLCNNCKPKPDPRHNACCDKAEINPCACFESWICSVHGTTHIGTHD